MNERNKLKQNKILRNITLALLVIALVTAAALATCIITVYFTQRAQEKAQAESEDALVYIENNQGAGRRNEASILNASKQEQPDEPANTPPSSVTVDDFQINDSLAVLDPGINIYSTSAVMIERESGRTVYSKEPMRSTYPASLTKIMTAIVGLELCPDLNATVHITDAMLSGLLEADASVAGFLSGEEVQYIDLFYGLMLASGADAANAIAISLCGSTDEFVICMNDMALKLGMVSTNYTNVTGLHDVKMRTTATDIALLLDYALDNETFRNIITKQSYTTAATNMHENGLTVYGTMFSMLPQTEFDNGAVILGGKTGTTTPAGQCLASFASLDGQEYILVTLGAFGYGEGERYNISDAMTLYSLLTIPNN